MRPFPLEDKKLMFMFMIMLTLMILMLLVGTKLYCELELSFIHQIFPAKDCLSKNICAY